VSARGRGSPEGTDAGPFVIFTQDRSKSERYPQHPEGEAPVMRRNSLLGVCLALGIAACQDQRTTEPTAPPAGPGAALSKTSIQLDRNQIKLPASAHLSDTYFAEATRRAIDPKNYVCDDNTPVVNWYLGKVNEFINQEPNLFNLLYVNLFADLAPEYEAIIFETTATPQYFGYTGEYTQRLLKTERDVKQFWDIQSRDIQMVGMHGTVLNNEAKTAATYASPIFFGLDQPVAEGVAATIHQALDVSQTLNHGNHPLFSFNSFALSAPELGLPDKIIMGDGVLEGYTAVGFDDVAPQAVYAHEFGHHIQYQNGYFNDPAVINADTQAEATMYTELMADAFSAYYLTHKRGAALNEKRVKEFFQVFFQIGDCAFTADGHHGTPNQRMRAAEFGFRVAAAAQKQGQILSSAAFHQLFVEEYPTITAPDAT
jgi:hypothetical protein